MNSLWKLSAVEQAAGIAEGRFSSLDVVDSIISRIESADGEVNAVVDMDATTAREAATAADESVRRGEELGALHGVPVTIKVNVDQTGWATTNGVKALANLVAASDAPVVRNLQNAGAVVIGRTNTPEFSFRAETDNPLHGRTRNPWGDLSHPEALRAARELR